MCVKLNRSHADSSAPTTENELHTGFWTRLLRMLFVFGVQNPVVQNCITVLAVEQAGTGRLVAAPGAYLFQNGTLPCSGVDVDRRDEDQGLSSQVVLRLQLHDCIQKASLGDAGSARRAAELHEMFNQEEDAAYWWKKAAELGDPDAIDYVRLILN